MLCFAFTWNVCELSGPAMHVSLTIQHWLLSNRVQFKYGNQGATRHTSDEDGVQQDLVKRILQRRAVSTASDHDLVDNVLSGRQFGISGHDAGATFSRFGLVFQTSAAITGPGEDEWKQQRLQPRFANH